MSEQTPITNGHHDPMTEIETLFATLPPQVRIALEQRDSAGLATALADLPEQESENIVGLLEQFGIIRRRPSLEDISASLPSAVREALEQQDLEAFNAAMTALPDDQREQLVASLEEAGYIQAQQPDGNDLVAMLPESVREAMRNQDVAALQTALEALPDEQQQEALAILEALQQQALDDISSDQLMSELPPTIQAALRDENSEALQTAFAELDPAEQQRVMQIFELLKHKE